MNEKIQKMLYIDEIREKLGFSHKKCLYKIVEGEVKVLKIFKEYNIPA